MHENPITLNELNELNNIFTNVMNKMKTIPDIPKSENLEYIFSLWTKAINEKPITFNDIETQLTHLTQTDTAKGSTIILQASKKLNLQDVVDVMGIGAKLKLKMSLATTNK